MVIGKKNNNFAKMRPQYMPLKVLQPFMHAAK